MKILILKPSSLGDVIQALPVLRILKKHNPAFQIHWWIAKEFAPLLANDPDLDGLFLFRRHGWTNIDFWRELLATIQNIRARRFDWVIDLQGLARSSLIAWLANGRFTIGLDDPREGARALYDIAVPRPSPQTHAVDWYLSVLERLRIPITPRFDWIHSPPPINPAPIVPSSNQRWIVLIPGARWETKRWPAENFSKVASSLLRQHPDLRCAILGGKEDQTLGAQISKEIANTAPARSLDLTGKTSLPEMIAWIKTCTLAISNDTGPLHAAAALQKPVISIFGPTNPRRTGPYRQMHHCLSTPLPCAPCLKDRCANPLPLLCLHSIKIEAVASLANTLLQPQSTPISQGPTPF